MQQGSLIPRSAISVFTAITSPKLFFFFFYCLQTCLLHHLLRRLSQSWYTANVSLVQSPGSWLHHCRTSVYSLQHRFFVVFFSFLRAPQCHAEDVGNRSSFHGSRFHVSLIRSLQLKDFFVLVFYTLLRSGALSFRSPHLIILFL